MTYEGRKATHLHCLNLGRPSPYEKEFKDKTIEKEEKVADKAPNQVSHTSKRRGKK